MHRKSTLILTALVASLALGVTAAVAGTVRSDSEPGITAKTILLGGTVPSTGSASSYASIARGADAYFKYVNARGGVNGRTITYKAVDDASNPSASLPLTRQLVEQDKVFAVFNSFGTSSNLAVRPYLNSAKVPQLFVASGATTWGRDYVQYPYAIGFQPSYEAEGWFYGKYLARSAAGATIAVLFQNDESGRELLTGLKRGLQRSHAKVIAAQPYAVDALDVSAQIAKLKSSGANTLAIFAAPVVAVQAYESAHQLGWKPKQTILNSGAASAPALLKATADAKLASGTISIAFVKDPSDPQWRTGLKLYRSILARYAPGASIDDALQVYGMAVAWTAVEALRKVGRNLTRASLQKVLDTFTATGNPFLMPGIAVKTAGRTDHFPIEQVLLQRWQAGVWRSFGGLWSYWAR